MGPSKEKIVLGMSGGLDSSVSLLLLREKGFDVIGASLKYDVWRGCKRDNSCCTSDAIKRAEKICKNFNIPHKIIDVSSEFSENVIDYFKQSLKKGLTPSPCVFCNPLVKFRSLIELANRVGAEKIATGHYARVEKEIDEKTGKNAYLLLKAKDESKDQTYSLSYLTQRELSKTIFPLGSFTKDEIYQIAKTDQRLSFFEDVKQSQDFCFLGKGELKDFTKEEVGVARGKIVNEKGDIIGVHEGVSNYTIGQRKSVGLPGGPYYVLAKNTDKNILIVTKDSDSVSKKIIKLSSYNFISGEIPSENLMVEAKLRSSSKPAKAILGITGKSALLGFEKSQFAPTPGQIAVFYSGEVCLGGGVIDD